MISVIDCDDGGSVFQAQPDTASRAHTKAQIPASERERYLKVSVKGMKLNMILIF
jgi:hypothetical protein